MEKSLQTLNRQEKIAVWSERIAACRSSGISVRAYCEGNGISTASYYKWQKKLFCLAAQSTPQFAEVCVAPAAKISTTVHRGVFPSTSIRVQMLRQQPCCCGSYSHVE